MLRRDRLKTVTVDAELEPGYNAIAVARELDGWLEEQSRGWPVGYRFEQGGELESSAKAQESIAVKLPVAGLIIVLLLVWQFDSLRGPAIILLTIPLGMIGVILGFLITQQPFGFIPPGNKTQVNTVQMSIDTEGRIFRLEERLYHFGYLGFGYTKCFNRPRQDYLC